MQNLAQRPAGDTATLTREQRERIGREGRIARALEAAQRRRGGRFSRIAPDRLPLGARAADRER